MAETKIEWTDKTWNPATGCTKVSTGCDHCYAATLARRFAGRNGYPADEPFRYTEHAERLLEPLRWRPPKGGGRIRCFVNSMSDLFHEQATEPFLDRVFAVMAACPHVDFQVLTKRPHRMAEYLAGLGMGRNGYGNLDPSMRLYQALSWVAGQFSAESDALADSLLDREYAWPLPNLWLGTSVENQDVLLPGWNLRQREPRAGETYEQQLARTRGHELAWPGRIDALLQCPAAVRFLSCEPLLGPLNLDLTGIHWLIAGGESGPGARPAHPDWLRSLRDQCDAAGVPFLFKQWGEWSPWNKGDEMPPPTTRGCLLSPKGHKIDPQLLHAFGPNPANALMARVGKHRARAAARRRAARRLPPGGKAMSTDYRVLTILQPWASAIALGVKRIESRSRPTKYRGPLLIHAGLSDQYLQYDYSGNIAPIPRKPQSRRAGREAAHVAGLFQEWYYRTLPLGAIIAVADLVDCVSSECVALYSAPCCDLGHNRASWARERALGDYSPGRYGWLLANVRPLPVSIPCRGKQGLWRPDAQTIAAVEAQIGRAA